MKKFIITSVLAALPLLGFSQTSAFDKFQNVEGIGSICINSKFFELAGNAEAGNEKAQKYLDVVNKLDNLKIFTTSEKKYKKALRNAVTSYLKDSVLEQVISVNSNGSKVKVYVQEGQAKLKEALLFVESEEEVVVITFTGAIDLKKLKDIQ